MSNAKKPEAETAPAISSTGREPEVVASTNITVQDNTAGGDVERDDTPTSEETRDLGGGISLTTRS